MTDLTYEPRTVCASCMSYRTRILGTSDHYTVTFNEANPGPYSRNWHCECKGFQFRQQCKHVEAAKEEVCFAGLDAFAGGSGIEPVDGKCPQCGGPVAYITVAV